MTDLKTIWDEVSKTKKKSFAKAKGEDGKLEYSHPVLNGKDIDCGSPQRRLDSP